MKALVQTSMPSNKPVTVIHTSTKGEEPNLTLKLDKISITLPVKEEYRGEVTQAMYELSDDTTACVNKKGKDRRYRINVILFLGANGQALVQANPFKPSDAFVRMEWNPAKIGLEGHEHLKALASTFLPDGYNGIVQHGKITRANIALDIDGININDLHFVPRSPLRSTIYKDAKGRIETLYLGNTKSFRYWRIYDKARHLKLPQGEELTRIERVHRTGIPLNTIGSLDNPFDKITVCDSHMVTVIPHIPAYVLTLIRDASRFAGRQGRKSQAFPTAIRAAIPEAIPEAIAVDKQRGFRVARLRDTDEIRVAGACERYSA